MKTPDKYSMIQSYTDCTGLYTMYSTVQYSTYSIILLLSVLYCIVLHRTAVWYHTIIVLCCTVYCTVQYDIIQYCLIQHSAALKNDSVTFLSTACYDYSTIQG